MPISGVIERMLHIAGSTSELDGLHWFNWLYLSVTDAVAARLAAGDFQDANFMDALDVNFAQLYFDAMESVEPPDCWRVFLDARQNRLIARIQFALAGMNAHINHDLAIALVATCQKCGVSPTPGTPQHQDYLAINTTLAGLVETAKTKLMVRLPGDALPAAAHVEDTIAAWSVSAARQAAWTHAEVLWVLRHDPSLAQRYRDMMDGVAALAGAALLVPAPATLAEMPAR